MPGLSGLDRSQITFYALEDSISTDNESDLWMPL